MPIWNCSLCCLCSNLLLRELGFCRAEGNGPLKPVVFLYFYVVALARHFSFSISVSVCVFLPLSAGCCAVSHASYPLYILILIVYLSLSLFDHLCVSSLRSCLHVKNKKLWKIRITLPGTQFILNRHNYMEYSTDLYLITSTKIWGKTAEKCVATPNSHTTRCFAEDF
jgi:hypothetical protein